MKLKNSALFGIIAFILACSHAERIVCADGANGANTGALRARGLSEMIREVAFARGAPNTRYATDRVLVAVHDGKMSAIATDAARMAISTRKLQPSQAPSTDFEALLPQDLNRLLVVFGNSDQPIGFSITDSSAALTAGDDNIPIERLAPNSWTSYPDYAKAIPADSSTQCAISTADLENAIKQFRQSYVRPWPAVLMTATPGGSMVLTSTLSANNQYDARGKVAGQLVTVKCNSDLLTDLSEIIREPNCTVEFNSATSPVVIRCENRLYEIMPMRP